MNDCTMLYRPGTTPNPEAWNLPIETRIVDSDYLHIALENGWYRHPDDFPKAEPAKVDATTPFSLLDETAPTIIETIPALTPDEVKALLEAERNGKSRKGVIAALEGALESA